MDFTGAGDEPQVLQDIRMDGSMSIFLQDDFNPDEFATHIITQDSAISDNASAGGSAKGSDGNGTHHRVWFVCWKRQRSATDVDVGCQRVQNILHMSSRFIPSLLHVRSQIRGPLHPADAAKFEQQQCGAVRGRIGTTA